MKTFENCATCQNEETHSTLDELFETHENDPLLAKYVATLNLIGYLPDIEPYFSNDINELWTYLSEEIHYSFECELTTEEEFETALKAMEDLGVKQQTGCVISGDYAYSVQENY